MSSLELSFASGESSLAVHRFTVHEELGGLFSVTIWARSPNPAIDLEAIVGQEAIFAIDTGTALMGGKTNRTWSGVVSSIEQVQAVQGSAGSLEMLDDFGVSGAIQDVQGTIRGVQGQVQGAINTVKGIPGQVQGAINTVKGIPGQVQGAFNAGQGIQGKVQGALGAVQGIQGKVQGALGAAQGIQGKAQSAMSGIGGLIAQGKAVQHELSTYLVRIMPRLWLLTQRRNYRIFQHRTIPDIIKELLGEWHIEGTWEIDETLYPKLEYKVQYGESDFSFFSRLLEEAGIAYSFRDDEGSSQLVLSDCYENGAMRQGGALPFVDNPNKESEREFVSEIRLAHEVRPEARTVVDYDFRNPAFPLVTTAGSSVGGAGLLEQYHYEPGSFLAISDKESNTPAADDHGIARHDTAHGQRHAERKLRGGHVGKRLVAFASNAIDLSPGSIFAIDRHPHPELTSDTRLLVTHFAISGSPNGEWTLGGNAVFTDIPYVPPHRTPKPRVQGVQSATVVGREGQEIHTDEYGRVRVQFPWDRSYKYTERSSCWMRVSQGWAGTGYGMVVIPRVGQEVLVGFMEGDPDHPIIVGRVYNATHTPPYRLPEHKTRSTWKSESSPGGNGFNEIMFEDKKGEELVWEQAQKNRRRLVKNDETITIGNNRQKLVKNDEDEQTLGNYTVYIGKDQDVIVKQNRRELVEIDSHLHVMGKRSQQINGKESLTVKGDRHEVVAKNHAMAVSEATHLSAGTAFVIEASRDLTLKGPGGFIRIDSSGVTICGNEVRINSGGSAGSGAGASPDAPEAAVMAATDDVSRTMIGQ